MAQRLTPRTCWRDNGNACRHVDGGCHEGVLGTFILACPDTTAYNPDTTDTPRTLTMTVKEKTGAQGWYSDSASVINTITMS